MCRLSVILFLLSAASASAQTENYTSPHPLKVLPLNPRIQSTVKFVVPGSSGVSPRACKIEDIPEEFFMYADGPVKPMTPLIAAIHYSPLNATYIIPGYMNYYSTDDSGLIGLIFFPQGQLNYLRSFLTMPDSAGDMNAAIDKYVKETDFVRYAKGETVKEDPSLDLRPAVSRYFFGAEGEPTAKLDAIDLTDGIWKFDFTSSSPTASGHIRKATIWVDLENRKLIKSVEDGQERQLYAKPATQPAKS
jgi:hypothetical protein